MENPGEATKLSVYFGRHDSVYGVPAFEVMCELLHRRGIPGATVLLGVDGIAHGRRPQAGSSAATPIANDGRRRGIRRQDRHAASRTVRPAATPADDAGAGVRLQARRAAHQCPELAVEADDHGFPLWQKLTVYTSQAAKAQGQPIHRAIVRRLRSATISGATTHRGVWGFHVDRRRMVIVSCKWAATCQRSRP